MFQYKEVNETCAAQASDRKVWRNSVQPWELMNNENNVELHLQQA